LATETKRVFGAVRQLPSGRVQASYRDPETGRRTPQTFDSFDQADAWLRNVQHGGAPLRPPLPKAPKRRGGRRAFGAIRQLSSGRWQASFVDATGFRHIAPGTFPSKVEGDRWLARQQTKIVGGDWTDPKRGMIGFAALADSFFETHEVALRRTSLARDRGNCDRYLIPVFGTMAISAIDLETVQAWITRMTKAGGQGKKPLIERLCTFWRIQGSG
jgi:hypothetical protein